MAKKVPSGSKLKKSRKSRNTYRHKFSHYCFECELHPEEDAEELERQLESLHLNTKID